MDFFRNPRAAGFGSAGAHPLATRTAPAPKPQPIPAQQAPTPRPFPAQPQQQQASQAGLHPSTLLYEKWILRPWEAESNEQDVKMTLQYQNYDTQQGRKVWLSGAFNDYLKQGIEPPPKVKEYFKSQGFDYDEVKTPTTEWASLPDRDKAGLLTAYYEGKLRDPWQQKTVARMIQQEAEDAKKLPAPGGDKTPAHLRWLQEWYKQNVDPAKTPAKLQEQFVASKLVEEPPAYTLNPAYTQYLQEMKASGLSLDDPSQWSERQEWYKTHPRPSKYLWGKEKKPGWYSEEQQKAIYAQNAQANQPAQAAAPAEATVPPAQAVGLRTQSPGAGAGTGTFTAQGPGGFTETLGQPTPPKPPAPPAAAVRPVPSGDKGVGGVVGEQARVGAILTDLLGKVAAQPSPEQIAAQAQVNAAQGGWKPVAKQPSPVAKKQGRFPLAGVPIEQAVAQSQVDAAQGGWEPIAQPSPVAKKQGRQKPTLKEKRKTSRTLRFLGDNPSLPTFAERREAAKQKAYAPRGGTYVGNRKQRGRQKPIALAGVPLEQAIAQTQVDAAQGGWEPIAQPSPVEYSPGFEKAYSAYEARQAPSPVVQPVAAQPSPVVQQSTQVGPNLQTQYYGPPTPSKQRNRKNYRGSGSITFQVSEGMKRIVGDSLWNKIFAGSYKSEGGK